MRAAMAPPSRRCRIVKGYLIEQLTLLRQYKAAIYVQSRAPFPSPYGCGFGKGRGGRWMPKRRAWRAIAQPTWQPRIMIPNRSMATLGIGRGTAAPVASQPSGSISRCTAVLFDFNYTGPRPTAFPDFFLLLLDSHTIPALYDESKVMTARRVEARDGPCVGGRQPRHRERGADAVARALAKLPGSPAYHFGMRQGPGQHLINIGVGPSNAKTVTDSTGGRRPHVAPE